jgi:CYTH domain-containing protein
LGPPKNRGLRTLMSDNTEIEYAFFLPKAPEDLPEEYTLVQQIYVNVEETKILIIPSFPEVGIDKNMLMLIPKRQDDAVCVPIDDSVHKQMRAISKPTVSNPAIRIIKDTKKNLCVRLRSNTAVLKSGEGIDLYELTIKASHKDSLPSLPVRVEVNVPLNQTEGERLSRSLDSKIETGRKIIKERYLLPNLENSELIWEIDVFHHPASFVKAEVEVPSMDTPTPIPPASWEAVDVTGISRFNNAELSLGEINIAI